MKSRLFRVMLLIFSIALLSNCKKEKEENTDFLTSKTWKRALVDKNTATNPPGKVLYEAVLNCQQDDVYSFKADGTLQIDNGTEKCDVNENKIEIGSYSNVSKEIVIKGAKYSLAEVSEDQIKYYITVPSVSGYDYLVFLLQ